MDDEKRPNKNMFNKLKSKIKSAPELEVLPDEEPKQDDMPADDTATKDVDTDVDPDTDEAVDDILKHDTDAALKEQDELVRKTEAKNNGKWAKVKDFFAAWWDNRKARWATIAVVVVGVGVLAAVPYTRYTIAGAVVKSTAKVTVVDSKSGDPVSGATVQLGTQKAETDAKGVATLKVHAGNRKFIVTKTYYRGVTGKKLVALSGNNFKTSLVALGHQVDVRVISRLTDKPLANATITVGSTHTQTDAKGLATVVLPSGASSQEATVSLAGYNNLKVTISASGVLSKNTFKVTLAGKLYFLSNASSGRLDVVKTDLDGNNRTVVLEGTGKEDKNTTSLLASTNWKYLALLSKREGDNASIYLIDTASGDKLTTVDEGNADFSLVGWSGTRFVYKVNRHGYDAWKPHAQALKSFDATTGKTLLLDQTQAEGDSSKYARQAFGNVYLIGNQVVYAKQWSGKGFSGDYPSLAFALDGKQASLETIGTDGSAHKTLKSIGFTNTVTDSIGAERTVFLNTAPYGPNGLYLSFNDNDAGSTTRYYEFEDGKVSDAPDLNNDTFYQTYNTYLISPSGGSTFWSEQRDGKNALLVGNVNGKSGKSVAGLSQYNTYGWYTDDYLLISKDSSELYIMPVAGGTPYKITDYYKPPISYYGYGGGYGGL